MRPLKFRAWDQLNHVWIEGFAIVSNGDLIIETEESEYRMTTPHAIVEQFTGLLDKNGKEIYEGDIVKAENRNNDIGIPNTGRIIFRYGSFQMRPDWVDHYWGGTTFESLDVIGNIHENPELVKQ